MVSMSLIGSTRPSTWVMSPSTKQRTDMGDGVAFTDVGQELVAQALALGGPAHQAGDVDKGQAGRDDFLRPGDFRQHLKARIGHRDVADVGLDGAEGIIGRLRRRRLRQSVEQGRFADVGQTDDAAFETHGLDARSSDKDWSALCGAAAEKASVHASINGLISVTH